MWTAIVLVCSLGADLGDLVACRVDTSISLYESKQVCVNGAVDYMNKVLEESEDKQPITFRCVNWGEGV